MSDLSKTLTGEPYIRVFVKVAHGPDFVRSYLHNFSARLEYVFRIPRLNNLQVVGITSELGNISAVITDSLDGFPEYLAKTKVIYKTDDMEATFKAAEAAGMTVLQGKTPVPIGYQGRFEMPGGYIVELFEVSPAGEQYMNPNPLEWGFV
ncbi:VOC family protein [Amycolatopsis anabasis]|uniref:VOC family protein n=1 Tax=Amycolatopsis anabasis TaxID=1840409 RepID=UPI00131DDCF6|nr:hypothetical protein [Amycolatopsis anabasis]